MLSLVRSHSHIISSHDNGVSSRLIHCFLVSSSSYFVFSLSSHVLEWGVLSFSSHSLSSAIAFLPSHVSEHISVSFLSRFWSHQQSELLASRLGNPDHLILVSLLFRRNRIFSSHVSLSDYNFISFSSHLVLSPFEIYRVSSRRNPVMKSPERIETTTLQVVLACSSPSSVLETQSWSIHTVHVTVWRSVRSQPGEQIDRGQHGTQRRRTGEN